MRTGRRLLATALVLALVLANGDMVALADSVLTLPKSLQVIDEEAFYGDTSIDKVVLSNKVKEIRSKAFSKSTLSEINLPSSLTLIADDAFDGPDKVKISNAQGKYARNWAIQHRYLTSSSPEAGIALYGAGSDIKLESNTIVDYSTASGDLLLHGDIAAIRAGKKYRVVAYCLNEIPNFANDYQVNSRVGGYLYNEDQSQQVWLQNYINESGFVLSSTKLKKAKYVRITIGFFENEDDSLPSTWSNYGLRIIENTSVSPTSITINSNSIVLAPGESMAIEYAISPNNADDKTVNWSSSNTAVATVDDYGFVEAVAIGNATITAKTSNGKKATCTVTVKNKQVTTITLNKSSASIAVGETLQLTASVEPYDATNQNIKWASSNSSIATVDENGVVTAIKNGPVTITAAAIDGSNVTAQCIITVNPKTILITGITLKNTDVILEVGESTTLSASIAPTNATNKAVTWSSSNESVATITGSGVVKAKSVGATVITALANDGSGTYAECIVSVKNSTQKVDTIYLNMTSGEISIGETIQLNGTCYPLDAANRNISWSSSNSSIASVDVNGLITGIASGSVIITATAQDGSETKATCSINVKKKVVLASSVSIDDDDDWIYVTAGDSEYLTDYTILPSDANQSLSFTSADTSIATVTSAGKVTGKKAGETYIYGRTEDSTNLSVMWYIIVQPKIQRLTLNKHEITISSTSLQNVQLSLSSYPTVGSIQAKWKVSSSGYLSKNSGSGSTFTFRGKKAGTVTITVTPNDGGSGTGDTCIVHIVDSDPSPAAPANVRATVDSSNIITVTWDNDPMVEKYKVNYSLGPWWLASKKDKGTIETYTNSVSFGAIGSSQDHFITVMGTTYDGTSSPVSDEFQIGASGVGYLDDEEEIHATGVNIGGVTTLTVGVNSMITANVSPSNADDTGVTWKSSNTSIVSISGKGNTVTLIPKAVGSATITATADDDYYDAKATITVTVKKQTINVTGISLSPASAELAIGGKKQLTASLVPSNASNSGIKWECLNTELATISSTSGTSTTVTAKKSGYVTIRATADDSTNGIIVGETTIHITGDEPTPSVDSVTLDVHSADLVSYVSTASKGSVVIKATVSPSSYASQVQWKVTGDTGAVSYTTNGTSITIQPNSVSTRKNVIVTASIGGVSDSCNVRILDRPVISVNGSAYTNQGKVSVDAYSSDLTVTWSANIGNLSVSTAVLTSIPTWGNNEAKDSLTITEFIDQNSNSLIIPKSLLKQYSGKWIKVAVGAYDNADGTGKQAWTQIGIQVNDSTPVFSGGFDTHAATVELGNSYQLNGTVSVTNSKLSAVKITVDSYAETEANSFMRLANPNVSIVNLGEYDCFIADTNKAPLNKAGTYVLKLFASESGGSWKELDQFTLIVAEPSPVNLVTKLLDVHRYTQGDSRWGNEYINDNAPTLSTISAKGCAMTCVAMAERYRKSDDETITPLTIKASYKFTNSEGTEPGNSINWDNYSGLSSGGKGKASLTHSQVMEECYKNINNGKPSVIGMNTGSTGNGNSHYVLVYGYKNLDPNNMKMECFLVKDPAGANRQNLQVCADSYYFRQVYTYSGAARITNSGGQVSISQYVTFDQYLSINNEWIGSSFIAEGGEVTSNIKDGSIADRTSYTLTAGDTIDVPFSTDTSAVKVGLLLTSADEKTTYANKEIKSFTTQGGEKVGNLKITLPTTLTTGTYLFILTSQKSASGDSDVRARVKVRISGLPAPKPTNAQVLSGVKEYFSGSDKYNAAVLIAESLVADFEPAFIAGILGNVVYEGNTGLFECCWGSTDSRWNWLNNGYDYDNVYGNKHDASGKYHYIYSSGISLKKVKEMSTAMVNAGYNNLFGLGSIQWTVNSRNPKLIDLYIEKANGKDSISEAQAREAEAEMLVAELSGKAGYSNYRWVYTGWYNDNVSELNSSESAYNAGKKVCQSYEVPKYYDQYWKWNPRAVEAQKIYEAMTGQ